ncbi:hypothetical protein C4561_04710, partial [candidate division WWE3 bacterium]
MKAMENEQVNDLDERVTSCSLCHRLKDHRESRELLKQFGDFEHWNQPVPGFGDVNARLLTLGLAPGAHGANRTGRVFTGDYAGDRLYEALHQFGFSNQGGSTSRDDGMHLNDVYITNIVRCVPLDFDTLPHGNPVNSRLSGHVKETYHYIPPIYA